MDRAYSSGRGRDGLTVGSWEHRAMAGVRGAQQRDVSDAAGVKAAGWRDSYARLVRASVLAPFTQPSFWEPKLASLLGHPDSFFLVDTADGEVRGLAHGSLTGVPYLESLRVRAGHRGRGIGRELMRAVAVRVCAQGTLSLHLDVVSGNDRALRFYRRLGGVDLGTHPAGWAYEVTETSMVIPDVDAPQGEKPDGPGPAGLGTRFGGSQR